MARVTSKDVARAAGVSQATVSYVLNNVAGHLGMLKGWTPWMVASAPSLLFLLLSFGAFSWLVRYR